MIESARVHDPWFTVWEARGWLTEPPGPPAWPPGPDRAHYLPELFHFARAYDVPLNVAMRVTAQQVARWADRYEAFPLSPSAREHRAGPLPEEPHARAALIDEIFAWFEPRMAVYLAPVNLFRGEQPLLRHDDGAPGVLALSPEEFASLRETWARSGLPGDLYYPAREQRTEIEVVRRHGALVRIERRYSPLSWANRPLTADVLAPMPSEAERARAFQQACAAFSETVMRRVAELKEAGRPPDEGEIRRLAPLLGEMARASSPASAGAPRRREHGARPATDEESRG